MDAVTTIGHRNGTKEKGPSAGRVWRRAGVRGPRGHRSGGMCLAVAAAVLLAGTPIRDASAQTTGPGRISETLEQARQLYEELLPAARRLGDSTLLDRMKTPLPDGGADGGTQPPVDP